MRSGTLSTETLRERAYEEIALLTNATPDQAVAAWHITEYIRILENGNKALQSTVDALEDCLADLRG